MKCKRTLSGVVNAFNTDTALCEIYCSAILCFHGIVFKDDKIGKKKMRDWRGGVSPYSLKCDHLCLRDIELLFSGVRTNT